MHWSQVLSTLGEQDQIAFRKDFDRCREDFLDTCRGACVLKEPKVAKIVADSLMHFDGDRYHLGDFVIMPNHFHVLVTFPDPQHVKSQRDSWLHYTARKINQEPGKSGKFWQQEPFDHLVRSSGQCEYLRNYMADNPRKAKLQSGHYFFRRGPR